MVILGTLNDPLDMRTPEGQRLFAFRKEIMALIYGCNPGNRTALVIENLISHMRRDTKPCHSGYAGPS